jgi:hypothetical protein
MTDKRKEKTRTGGRKRRALTVLEKHTICKKRQEPKHLKESLAAFGTHFPDANGDPVKSSTMSDVLKDSAKWLAVNVSSSGGKFFEYLPIILVRGLCN